MWYFAYFNNNPGLTIAFTLVCLALYRPLPMPEKRQIVLRFPFKFLQRGWYIDDVYDRLFIRPYIWLGKLLARGLDEEILHDDLHDRLIVRFVYRTADFLSFTQSGQLNWNIFGLLLGLIGTLAFLLLRR